MTRIVSHIGLIPIQDTTFEGQDFSAIESDIGGGLRGISKNTTWDGTFVNFSGGVCTNHLDGDYGAITLTGSNFKAFWFKNTGFKFDDTKPNKIDYATPVTGKFSIAVDTDKVICGLYPEEAIVLLEPPQSTFVFGAIGTAPAVEWLILRNT